MKRVLLICPSFHGYELEIIKEFELRGIDVFFIEDDFVSNNSPIYKRISGTLFKNKVTNYYNKKFFEVKDVQFDYVLVVKGGEVTPNFLDTLQSNQKSKFILYLWDSIENNKNALKLIKYFDQIYSFDQDDCINYQFKFKPLFYTNHKHSNCAKEYDLMFIGAFHSDRYYVLDQISKQLPDDVVINFTLFTGKITYLYNKYVTKNISKNKKIKFIFKRISLEDAILLEDKSKVIVDINNYKQSGMTTRAFDCINRKVKMITTNSYIKSYDFYNENNIQIIDRKNFVVDLNFLSKDYIDIDQKILSNYSVKSWVDVMLS
jgi:hypothetical protein